MRHRLGTETGDSARKEDYGMRIYDPRLGKFLSVDPLSKEYPWNSTYAFAENDVIRNIDLDGAEKTPYMGIGAFKNSGKTELETVNGTTILNFIEYGNKYRVAEYSTKLADKDYFNRQFPRTLYFVHDETIVNESDYNVGDGSVIRTAGTHWHFWMSNNDLCRQMKQTKSVTRGMGTAVFGAALIGTAGPAIAKLAPLALRGLANEASLLKYIPKSYGTYIKVFGANLGLQYAFNGKDADVYDAAAATVNPWVAFFTNPVINYKPLAGDVAPTIGQDRPNVMAKKFLISAPFFLLGTSMQTVNPNGYNPSTDYLLNTAEEAADNIAPDPKTPDPKAPEKKTIKLLYGLRLVFI